MSFLDALRHRLRPLFRVHEFDRDLDDEFRHHRELEAQEFPERGPHFGSRAYYKEETRSMTALGWLDVLGQDLRYAWRNLLRTPAFTGVAVLSLALGIGANTAIFSLIYSLLLLPLPVSHPEQLALVRHSGPDLPNDQFSYREYQALRQAATLPSITALGSGGDVPVTVGGLHSSASVDAVDGDFFATIGLQPGAGRLITSEDERTQAPVVVISDGLWTEWFNRTPDAIGSTITMGRTAFTVIGVAPKSYQGLEYPGSFAAAVPLSTLALTGSPGVETAAAADSARLEIVGRLHHPTDLPGMAKSLDGTYRSCCVTTARAGGVELTGIEHGIPLWKFDIKALFGRLLLELMGAAGVVLLAACANLATLLLARAAARERELAVRLSLGASRRRLAIQMLVESGLLAALGALAGLVMAYWALRLIGHRLPDLAVGRAGLTLTGDVLGFTALVAALSVLVFGAVPAWRATQTNLIAPLNAGGRLSAGHRAGWLDRSMVVGQVALALVLVNGAGLFVATLRNLHAVHGGFATERTVSTQLDARGTAYESAGLAPLVEPLLSRAARIPGVRSATLSASVPVFGGRRLGAQLAIEGYTPGPDESMNGWLNAVTPGFFTTLDIGLPLGRDFTDTDRAGQQVAIVNEAFARQYLRDRNPLGATIRSLIGPDTILLQVVGVAGDARFGDLREASPPMMYVPLAQFTRIPVLGRIPVLVLSVRTIGDDRATPGALQNVVLTEAPGLRSRTTATIEASMDAALNRETLAAQLATLFGAVALILAGIGLYGVVSYRVAQRTREIGVRMALGADAPTVIWMVLKQALVLVATGVLVGTPLAFGGGRAVAAALYGLAGQNGFFVLGAGVLLAGVAVVASALPARHAAQVDPLTALRAD
jgi:predicted permease